MPEVQDRGDNRSDTDHEGVQRMFAAWERWDLKTLKSLVADGAIDSPPQSGEHFVGRANIMAMYHEVPGPPKITWRSVRGGPTVRVGEGIVECGEGPVHRPQHRGVRRREDDQGRLLLRRAVWPPPSRSRWAAQTQRGPRLAKRRSDR